MTIDLTTLSRIPITGALIGAATSRIFRVPEETTQDIACRTILSTFSGFIAEYATQRFASQDNTRPALVGAITALGTSFLCQKRIEKKLEWEYPIPSPLNGETFPTLEELNKKYGSFDEMLRKVSTIQKVSKDFHKKWVKFFSNHPELKEYTFSQILEHTSLNHLIECGILNETHLDFAQYLSDSMDNELSRNSKGVMDSLCGIRNNSPDSSDDSIDTISKLSPTALHILFGANNESRVEQIKNHLIKYVITNKPADATQSFLNLICKGDFLLQSPLRIRETKETSRGEF